MDQQLEDGLSAQQLFDSGDGYTYKYVIMCNLFNNIILYDDRVSIAYTILSMSAN